MRFEIETNRRASDLKPPSNVKLYIFSAIFVCVVTVGAVSTLAVLVPNNAAIIATVLGITMPIISGLLLAGLHGIAVNVDGLTTKIIDITAQKERVAGFVEGLAENPTVNLKKEP